MTQKLDQPAPAVIPDVEATAPGGDDSARVLGYGHRAYQPDPNAKYGFQPQRIRPLPHDPAKRWR